MVNLKMEYKRRLQIIYYKIIRYLEHTGNGTLSAEGVLFVHLSVFRVKGNVAGEPRKREEKEEVSLR